MSIRCSAWPMHSPAGAPGWVLRRREALTAARGPSPALHSSRVAVSPFIICLERRNAGRPIDASPSLLFLPPSPLQLLLRPAAPCFSFINPALDAGSILLHGIALDLSGLFGVFLTSLQTLDIFDSFLPCVHVEFWLLGSRGTLIS